QKGDRGRASEPIRVVADREWGPPLQVRTPVLPHNRRRIGRGRSSRLAAGRVGQAEIHGQGGRCERLAGKWGEAKIESGAGLVGGLEEYQTLAARGRVPEIFVAQNGFGSGIA